MGIITFTRQWHGNHTIHTMQWDRNHTICTTQWHGNCIIHNAMAYRLQWAREQKDAYKDQSIK